jgi:hypothetical protein
LSDANVPSPKYGRARPAAARIVITPLATLPFEGRPKLTIVNKFPLNRTKRMVKHDPALLAMAPKLRNAFS